MMWLLLVLPALVLAQDPPACGIPFVNQTVPEGRVIGGEDAERGAWPWQAGLEWSSGGSWNHYCGGSLLSAEWAITAAHCVTSMSTNERIVFGQLERDNWVGDEVTRSINSGLVIIHPDYSGGAPYPNDVAMVALDPVIDWAESPALVPHCLPSDPSNTFVNNHCWISGWGVTQYGGAIPDHLQQAKIDVMPNDECAATGLPISTTTDTNLCIFDREDQSSISCSGDSGGPLNCQVDGHYEMAGTSSWGWTGCPTDEPRVYHRTTYVLDWIIGIMG